MEAVRCGASLRSIQLKFGIPFSTIQERVKKNLPIIGTSLEIHASFSPEQEQDMTKNIKILVKLFYGFTSLQIHSVSYDYDVENNIKDNFGKERKLA